MSLDIVESPSPNRWKVTDGEDPDYYFYLGSSYQEAQEVMDQLTYEKEAASLYSCYEDEFEDLTEWEWEEGNKYFHLYNQDYDDYGD